MADDAVRLWSADDAREELRRCGERYPESMTSSFAVVSFAEESACKDAFDKHKGAHSLQKSDLFKGKCKVEALNPAWFSLSQRIRPTAWGAAWSAKGTTRSRNRGTSGSADLPRTRSAPTSSSKSGPTFVNMHAQAASPPDASDRERQDSLISTSI